MNLRTLMVTAALLAPMAGFAGDRDSKDSKDATKTEPDLIVTVRAGKQRAVLIQGAKDIRASEKNIAHVGIAEPGQVTIEGIRPGEVSVQVARQGSEKNFKLVVQVIP